MVRHTHTHAHIQRERGRETETQAHGMVCVWIDWFIEHLCAVGAYYYFLCPLCSAIYVFWG